MQDLILFPLYLIAILLAAYLYRNFRYCDSQLKKYFIPGLLVRIGGALGLGIIYLFYYHGGGDTFYYFKDSYAFNLAIQKSFSTFLQLLFLPADKITFALYDFIRLVTFFRDPSGWMADKVYGVLSVLSFHSYPVMALLMAFLSFTGTWVLFKTFASLYPPLTKQFAFAILFVPSVFFWGSGILKDSITFGCLGWVTYSAHQIFFLRRKILQNAIILLFMGFMALQIKAYIMLSFLPALLLWIFFTYRSRIGSQFLRVISGPSVLLISMVCGFLLINKLGNEFEEFSLTNLVSTSERFQQWHGYLAQTANASGYSLGLIDGTWLGILSKFPAAVNVTLFRPYLWEANNPVMLMAALESIFIFGFTLYILFRNGILNTLKSVLRNPDLLFCFSFSIAFAFAVGFSSYNFGALVRYKIPCIPFYLSGLIILNYLTLLQRRKKSEEKEWLRKRARRSLREIYQPAMNESQ